MARVTVEDCLEDLHNRFALVILASRRCRQLVKGVEPLVKSNNKHTVVSLREVAARKVHYEQNPADLLAKRGPLR